MTETAPKPFSPRGHGKPWTDEDDALLVKLWKEGKSATHIASLLPGHRKRNSILSRIHRKHKDLGREKATARKAYMRPQVRPVPRRPATLPPINGHHDPLPINPQAIVEQPLPEGEGVDLMEVKDGMCRFPYGSNAPFKFCGEPTEVNSSYCKYHCRVVYTGQPVRRMELPRDRRPQWIIGR